MRLVHVRSGLADVIRKLESGELTPKVANALVYAYATLAGVLTTADLEERVAALERSHTSMASPERRLAS